MSLIKDLGIDPYDGLMAAHLPQLDSVMREYYQGHCTVYTQDDVVYDMIDEAAPKSMKWWRVKEAARQLGMNIVEPFWSGAAQDFNPIETGRYSHQVRPSGTRLYIRAFTRGPWILIETETGEIDENRA